MDLVTFLAGSDDTVGAYSLFETISNGHGGPPTHYHKREDEAYFILEGEYRIFKEGEDPLAVTAGSFVFVPKGVVHTYKCIGELLRRMIVALSPAGGERFFRTAGQPATDRTTPPTAAGPPDPQRLAALAQQHDIMVTGPPP